MSNGLKFGILRLVLSAQAGGMMATLVALHIRTAIILAVLVFLVYMGYVKNIFADMIYNSVQTVSSYATEQCEGVFTAVGVSSGLKFDIPRLVRSAQVGGMMATLWVVLVFCDSGFGQNMPGASTLVAEQQGMGGSSKGGSGPADYQKCIQVFLDSAWRLYLIPFFVYMQHG
uniref:Uncharacterized protein n=1 Tax=Strombidinopsis acuminata TaxID=141414 RepID=A0A7S3VZ90_9SPIT